MVVAGVVLINLGVISIQRWLTQKIYLSSPSPDITHDKTVGKGSSGSSTYCAIPVTHAWPDMVGQSVVAPNRFFGLGAREKLFPVSPFGKNLRSIPASFGIKVAILALVPVPQGERSKGCRPGLGPPQSNCPVEPRRDSSVSHRVGWGVRHYGDGHPETSGLSGCTHSSWPGPRL
ncbi:MAG: hypothetical protein Ct9H300mP14_15280 [Gammaproteobacteria bacterium]|nr:MAG: hypothetical protein Ct9H300mP14_15280 [Gammaproteobacteria bacterium]